MTSEEFQLQFMNNLEVLSKQVERLTTELKRNNDLLASVTATNKDLKDTVGNTNKTFEQVAGYLKDIYAKVQGLELVQKLIGGLGNMGPMFGGGAKPAR